MRLEPPANLSLLGRFFCGPYFSGFRKTGVLAWSGRAAGGLSAVREGHSVFGRLGRVEGHAAQDALAFFDENDLIRVDILECFNKPARPADFDQLDFFRFSDSKMHAQIVLRKIPAAAAHFVDLRMLMRSEEHTS